MAHSGMPLRATQRAPRSCIPCAWRKVRCDKSVPCSTCIRRGQPEACAREMVLVRGEVTTYKDGPHMATYEELRQENERLQRELAALKAEVAKNRTSSATVSPAGGSVSSPSVSRQVEESPTSPSVLTWPGRDRNPDQDEDGLEERLWQNLNASSAASPPQHRRRVSTWDNVIIPSRGCSEQLIAYDKTWNSWVHFALEYPRFEEDCDSFISGVERGLPVDTVDPAWLTVYFAVLSTALLMMDEDEAEKLPLPNGLHHQDIGQLWYDSAIFCLHQADFMRVPDVRAVQAIAILGISFNNRGDSLLGKHMWSCALRIARRIGLNTPFSQSAATCLSAEGQHRLWWTLVIVEWLNLPHRTPEIDEVEFDVPLDSFPAPSTASPSSNSYSEHQIHPVHYHVFMAQTSAVVYRFHAAFRAGLKSIDEVVQVVRKADEELAQIIDSLPFHLQPDHTAATDSEHNDTDKADGIRRLEATRPWLKWQRFDITLVLLHLRIRIHRTLQGQWLLNSERSSGFDWARTVCVKSAVSVIWINKHWDQPAYMRKQWALSYHIFVSAIVLLRECQSCSAPQREEYVEAIQTALELLDRVKSGNALAYHACVVLREKMESNGVAG